MLKDAGYITIGQGKVFHPGAPNGDDDSAYSWSPEGLPYYHSPIEGEYGPGNKTALVWSFEGFTDDDLPDGQIAAHAIANIQALKANRSAGDTRPFALFVGFHKPHTPILFPAKYWYMTSDDTLPKHPGPPIGAPPIATNAWGSMHEYDDIAPLFPDKVLEEQCTTNASVGLVDPRCRMPDNMTMHIRHGYRAAIAYTDAQVGRVMAEMKSQALWDDSAVFLTSEMPDSVPVCAGTGFIDRLASLCRHGVCAHSEALHDTLPMMPCLGCR
jgi:arylsulfatase A-like enzyme